MPTNEYSEEDKVLKQQLDEIEKFKRHDDWANTFKDQMSTYGSPDNRHVLEMEYEKELQDGSYDFDQALRHYAALMAVRIIKMRENMKKLDEKKQILYGDK